ncbi:hypothetical protein ADK75_06150 [Streptomyces virginiae]|uniref:Uncharacterized protein n=1 Tax=Streptomyces virginiae TaxID=1961 RepID=A0A0L8N2J9_STRVG|nr:hypothetical protein ADK75_06150 [Streptomyces virginiae]
MFAPEFRFDVIQFCFEPGDAISEFLGGFGKGLEGVDEVTVFVDDVASQAALGDQFGGRELAEAECSGVLASRMG